MNIKSFLVILIGGLLLFASCNQGETKFPQANVSELTPVDVHIKRYGEALFALDTSNLKNELLGIQNEFSLFLGNDLDDSLNFMLLYNYVTDTQLISTYKKTMEVYPNLKLQEKQISDAFSRFMYQFPSKSVPDVYTYVSDFFYEQPIVLQNNSMAIAIDLYLGSNYPIYQRLGLPYYKIKWMRPESIAVDVMKAMYFNSIAPVYRPQTLLDRMIDGGKLLAYLDAVSPESPDEIKISYSTQQLNWANQNEKNIWAFLIKNELLYRKDYQTQTKLIQDGPFTTGFGNESPSRLGIFIGWKIVLAYLNSHPDESLADVIKMTDSQKLLQQSGYKP